MHNAQATFQIDRASSEPAPLPTRILLEAIARGVCVAAVYNRSAVTLAPHIVYTRHGELFVDAVAVERDGKPPRELKLGTFKLAGLGDMAIVPRRLERFNGFVAGDPKYAGVTIFSIEA